MESGISWTPSGWHLSSQVTGVAIDSRKVEPGFIFVAIQGSSNDGHLFIDDAIARGAMAVVGERDLRTIVPYIQVDSARSAAASLAATFYRHPSQKLVPIGVTGTNGKTSVVYWIQYLLKSAGREAGMISSVINDTGSTSTLAELTTPESPELHRLLNDMVGHGLTHAVIEVSSHGIAQHRVDDIAFQLAVLTNITREHLDFHGTMAQYVNTKASLFERVPKEGLGVVLNADDAHFDRVQKATEARVLSYGVNQGDVRARILAQGAWWSEVEISYQDITFCARINHPGDFNVYNATAVVAAGYLLGIEPSVMEATLPRLPSVPGRMQVIHCEDGPMVVVDYAHTPDGLMQSLRAVSRFEKRAVWLVFGARGGRDVGKRPEMGRIAATYADHVVLTADSPNFEDAALIAEDIKRGMQHVSSQKLIKFVLDRAEAIRWAVERAEPEDVVLVTGRGPEQYQYFGSQGVRLVDAEVAQEAILQRKKKGDAHAGSVH